MGPRRFLFPGAILLGCLAVGVLVWQTLADPSAEVARKRAPTESLPRTLTGDSATSLPTEQQKKRSEITARGLRGRVVDPKGNPVSATHVFLLGAEDRKEHKRKKTDGAGRFALGIPASGGYVVSAWHQAVGVAELRRLQLTSGRPTDLGDLQLHEVGTLAGVFVYSDGNAVSDLKIGIGRAGKNPKTEGQTTHRFPVPDTPGMLTVRTDAQGSFRVTGLRPAIYFLHPTSVFGKDWRFPIGTENIRIVLRDHRVRIKVQDEKGQPKAGVYVNWMIARNRSSALDQANPAPSNRPSPTGPGGILDLFAEPRAIVRVHVYEDGFRPITRHVTLPAKGGRNETEILLRMVPSFDSGRVEVFVTGPDNKPLHVHYAELASPESGDELVHARQGKDSTLLPAVPPGTYLLRVGPGPMRQGRRDYFSLRQKVAVVAKQTTQVRLRAWPGGRVSVRVRLPGSLGHAKSKLRVLWRAANTNEFVSFGEYDQANRTLLSVTSLDLSKAFRCGTLLAPGRYTVRVEAAGCVPAETTVEVLPLATAPVELRLRLKPR